MNKLLLLSSFFLGAQAFSQVVLTNDDLKPTVDETFSYKNTAIQQFPEITHGANQTWDISSIVGAGTFELECKESNYTGANVLISDNNSNLYYNYLTTGVQLVRITDNIAMTENYSDSKQLLSFPLELNAETTDTYASTISITGGPTITTSGSQTIKVIGYGTLTTASGTYTNVMAVNTTDVYSSTQNGQTTTMNLSNIIFYKAGVHSYIARLAAQSTQNGGSMSAQYLVGNSLSVNEMTNHVFVIAPNPATDGFQIKGDQIIEAIQLIDMNGKIIPVDYNSSTSYVDISSLTSGIYNLQVITNYGMTSQKVVKR